MFCISIAYELIGGIHRAKYNSKSSGDDMQPLRTIG